MKPILMRPDFANTEYMAVLADEWRTHEFATPISPDIFVPPPPSASPPPPGAADASKVAAPDADHVG